jgi:hypothetical protein
VLNGIRSIKGTLDIGDVTLSRDRWQRPLVRVSISP